MKIKTKVMDYGDVISLKTPKHKKPKTPSLFFRVLLKIFGLFELLCTNFSYKTFGMEKLKKNEPALFLMNHSSFIDLEIATNILFPKPLNIVCTSDGFVGKENLMRNLGCIPTEKFVTDSVLVRDLVYATKTLKNSVLMYPEASYSFDGTETPLPESLPKLIKLLKIPVVMIKTEGAFLRQPLYNMLKKRKVKTSANVEYILSSEQIEKMSFDEIMSVLNKCFDVDGFAWQQNNKIKITEDFRADGLNRVLYKCPSCLAEGKTKGKGIYLTCNNCGKKWELDEYGYLRAVDGNDIFSHIPDWYAWERECVKKELENNEYNLDVPVDIKMIVDAEFVYEVGEGRLVHNLDGFRLTGCNGRLDYSLKPLASYSLYSDYYWYELGDMICIGDTDKLYYCFPKVKGDFVAKARLATEELYKINNFLRK